MKINKNFYRKPDSKRQISLEPALSEFEIRCENQKRNDDVQLDLSKRTRRHLSDLPETDPYHSIHEGVIFLGKDPYGSDSLKLLRYKIPAGYRDMGTLVEGMPHTEVNTKVPTPEYVIDVRFRIELTENRNEPYRAYIHDVILISENRDNLRLAPFSNTFGYNTRDAYRVATLVCHGNALDLLYGKTEQEALNNLILRLPDLMTRNNNLDLRLNRNGDGNARDVIIDTYDRDKCYSDSSTKYIQYITYWALLKAVDELTDETPETIFNYRKLRRYVNNEDILIRMHQILNAAPNYRDYV